MLEDFEHRFSKDHPSAALRIDYSKAESSVKTEMNSDFMELYKILAALFKKNY